MSEKQLMNLTEYAKHIGRSVPLVSRWCVKGGKLSKAIKKKGGRKLLRVKIADAILAVSMNLSQQRLTAGNDHQQNIPNKKVADHLIEEEDPNAKKDATPKSTYGYQDALTKDKYYAAALKKLDLDQKNGIVVLKMDVEKESFECARQVRDALQNIPARIAAVVAAMTKESEVEKILDAEIRQSLEALVLA